LDLLNVQLPPDQAAEGVFYLLVTRDRGDPAVGRVLPDVVFAAVAPEPTALTTELF